MTTSNAKPNLTEDPLLSEAEVADYLRCLLANLRMKRLKGKAPASIRFDGRVLYRQSAVVAWLNALPSARVAPKRVAA